MKDNRYQHISDTELLEKYSRERDPHWIGVLLERYTLLLYGLCMKYLKEEHAAKDAVQQIFLKVLTEVPKYKIDYFKSWLYMVGKNHCLMQLRSNGNRPVKEIQEEHTAAAEDNLEQVKQNEETYEKLEEAINELNDEQKQCVILFYLKKKSYQQIAEITGYSLMQVKSYIQNGKRNLKIILEKKLDPAKSKGNG